MTAAIRPGRDADAAGFIALIRACWSEYPSIVFDLDGEIPELRALAGYYARAGGALWAAEDATGRLVGMIAVRPDAPGTWEICRLYVDRAQRGTGLAARLLTTAEAHAAADRLVLWSDTRFTRAHRFYEKHSFLRTGPIRPLHDRSHSLEFGYARPRAGVLALDAAAASSAIARAAAILADSVAAGARVGFRAPLARAAAETVWRLVATAVAEGRALLLAGFDGGVLAGVLALDLATAEAAPHRAVLTHLLVDPAHGRRGLARALLQTAEDAATRAGRSLLTVETGGDVAVLRAAGWIEAGRIPEAIGDASGEGGAATILYRPLSGAGPIAAA